MFAYLSIHSPEPGLGLKFSVSWAGSTTAIRDLIQTSIDHYEKLLNKKAFVHAYLSEGLEEAEFFDKVESCKDLVDLYDLHYAKCESEKLEQYENRRDLGMLEDEPFQWNMKRSKMVALDPKKSVQLKW